MKNNKYIIFTAMGMELVGLIVSSVFIGQFLDQKYNLKGLCMIGLSMASLAGWIYHIVFLAKKIEEDKNKDE